MALIREHRLANGLLIAIFDETNRYFGDYHRVFLRVVLHYDLTPADRNDPFWSEARDRLGPELRLEKTLERMGVADSEVEGTVAALVDNFLATADEYLTRPDYPRQLVIREMEKRRKTTRIY